MDDDNSDGDLSTPLLADQLPADAPVNIEGLGGGVSGDVGKIALPQDDAETVDAPTAPGNSSAEDGDGDDVEIDTTDEGSGGGGASSFNNAGAIDPPPSRTELLRDRILAVLDHRLKSDVGLIVLAVIIVDGAFFFFLLVGWQGMCSMPSRTDCQPRNYWYNMSIQVLNGCFTYMATVALPWRLANFANLWPCRCCCPGPKRRECGVGLDLYGRPTDKIWFHISLGPRRLIVVLLLGNALTQYANQVTRIIYHSYELADEFPGNVWTNVFFFASMVLAAIGGFVQLREETKLRKGSPNSFPLDPVDLVKKYLPKWWRKCQKERKRRRDGRTEEKGSTRPTLAEADDVEDRGEDGDGVRGTAGEGGDEEDDRRDSRRSSRVDRLGRSVHLPRQQSTARIATFWTSFRSWWRNDRPSLGLWGL